MPNYGFVIDLRKCIGCHACTIACKSEHDIPVGVNRCWVKTVEKGTFPDTRRFFFPVLCNQCEEAPCLKICPTGALFKRRDGIVDLNGAACIGCKACMVACPYDQLFIDPNTRTAEKCNFCANRVENELQPACVSVCPTECRIFGDLDDATSEVARIVEREAFTVRKPEKGTGPKVFYLGGDTAVMQPEIAARPFMFKEGQVHLRPLGAPVPDPAAPGDPRVDYDAPHRTAWGLDLVLYLLTKGLSTGAMLIAAWLWLSGNHSALVGLGAPLAAGLFAALTAAVLVKDLERPERFAFILTRPNWQSWMARGAFLLTAHGMLCGLWVLGWIAGWTWLITAIAPLALVAAFGATVYTSFLFAQGLARDLWQGPHSAVDLVVQAIADGSALLLLFAGGGGAEAAALGWTLAFAAAAHALVLAFDVLLTPSPTLGHELAIRTIRRGHYAGAFWPGALAVGGIAPVLLVVLGSASGGSAIALVLASLAALAGNFAWDYVWVGAGQAVPNS